MATTLQLSLLIVAKAKMNNGLCYMGYDANTNTLVRPLYSAEEHRQCWPHDNDFSVGETIQFNIIRAHPVESSLPHRNEDSLVNNPVPQLGPPRVFSATAMFETLFNLSFPTVGEIFGNENILENCFVTEGTDCPSVGIYSCTGATVELQYREYDGKQKKRCIIKEPSKEYDFSITAKDSYQKPESDDSVLLLLGLGRPWVKPGQTEPERRCYIFVIGMITKPSDSNMSQVDQLTASLSTANI